MLNLRNSGEQISWTKSLASLSSVWNKLNQLRQVCSKAAINLLRIDVMKLDLSFHDAQL